MTANTQYLGIPYPQGSDDPRIAHTQMQNLAMALESLGNAWLDYTPDIPGFTLGNGTLDCRYQKVGRTVHWNACLTIGSTSVLPQVPRFSFPVAPYSSLVVGQGYVSGNSANTADIACVFTTYTTAGYAALFFNTNWVRNTNPYSGGLLSGDQLAWSLTYESAT